MVGVPGRAARTSGESRELEPDGPTHYPSQSVSGWIRAGYGTSQNDGFIWSRPLTGFLEAGAGRAGRTGIPYNPQPRFMNIVKMVGFSAPTRPPLPKWLWRTLLCRNHDGFQRASAQSHPKDQQHSSSTSHDGRWRPCVHEEHRCITFNRKGHARAQAQQSVGNGATQTHGDRTSGTSPGSGVVPKTRRTDFQLRAAFSGERLGTLREGRPGGVQAHTMW